MTKSKPLPDLSNARFLLKKAEQELWVFSAQPDDHVLFNLLCTLNHLPNWVIGDEEYSEKVKKEAKVIQEEFPMQLIHDLCDRVKHFHKKDRKRVRPEVIKDKAYGAGLYGVGNYGAISVYWAEADGKRCDILAACNTAVQIWRRLLIPENLDVAKIVAR